MTLRALYRRFISARVTVLLLVLLALLLLVTVALPQRAVLGEERFEALIERSDTARLLLDDLGLGALPTHPLFLAILGLFFLNLAAVLLSRLGPTWRRTRLKPRPAEGLQAWARLEERFTAPLPADWSSQRVARTLMGHGFKVRAPAPSTVWAVKHRTAPLGFLLFHLSFFLICLGGLAIFYTRFIGTARISEGQEFAGEFAAVYRQPPFGSRPNLRLALEEVRARTEDGKPVLLEADFRLLLPGRSQRQESRVNHPARWGPVTVLVETAGLAPVLWLQDERGFTIDRVVVPIDARGTDPTTLPIADGSFVLLLYPLASDREFPEREELATTEIRLVAASEDGPTFDDRLRPGEVADLGGARVVLEEIRYWVGFRVVSERGGGLLIVGFAAGVIGLLWRLGLYRREVAVDWDEKEFRLVGRSEYYARRFELELEALARALREPSEGNTG